LSVNPALSQQLAGGNDTIVALATAPGRGAISVVRMSGPQALAIAESVADPWPIDTRRVTLCRIVRPDHTQVLDQALVTCFVAPDSFTGEDLVEISGHGGNYVPALLMEALISRGARQALPGEFDPNAWTSVVSFRPAGALVSRCGVTAAAHLKKVAGLTSTARINSDVIS